MYTIFKFELRKDVLLYNIDVIDTRRKLHFKRSSKIFVRLDFNEFWNIRRKVYAINLVYSFPLLNVKIAHVLNFNRKKLVKMVLLLRPNFEHQTLYYD